MRAFYFERKFTDGPEINSYQKGFYIPDENIILASSICRSFSSPFSIIDDEGILSEIKLILAGASFSGRVIYTNTKKLEFDNDKLKAIIKDVRSAKRLNDKIRLEIENLTSIGWS